MSELQNHTPTVSVIMPCLNAEKYVADGVASVLGQTLDNLELIVIDNGSTDRTSEILAAIGDTRLRIVWEAERGVSRARNTGLTQARGDYVAFLDADDTWSVDFLEKLHSALVGSPDSILAYCGWQNVGVVGMRGQPFIPPEYEGPDKMALLLVNNRWPIHAALTRRNSIVQVGGFDPRLIIAEDYLLWLELAMRGRLVRVPEVLAFYRHHSGVQATRNLSLGALQTLEAKQMFLARHPQVAAQLGPEQVEDLTWNQLVKQGNALHWRGDLENARPVQRKALLAGKGRMSEKLRMLPSLLPLRLHRAIINAKENMERG